MSRPATLEQLNAIVHQHFTEVERYFTPADEANEYVTDVLGWLDQLSAICHQPPESAPFALYLRATSLLHCVSEFLNLMHVDLAGPFGQSVVGCVWAQASQWCQAASIVHQSISRDQVWDWIAPVAPDTLDDIGNYVFEAKWASPVPEIDIELLRRTEGVRILGDVFEPAQMPGGTGIRFTIDV